MYDKKLGLVYLAHSKETTDSPLYDEAGSTIDDISRDPDMPKLRERFRQREQWVASSAGLGAHD